MKTELQQPLFQKYPKIFRQRTLPMDQTCMCWGCECGDGWYDLLDRLCTKIQAYVDEHNIKQVEAVQVKEKFGTLRFYINGGPDAIHTFISEAESESAITCEECGKPGKLRGGGWLRTLCDNHSDDTHDEAMEAAYGPHGQG